MQLALSQPCSYLDLGGSESSQTTHSFSSLCLHLPPAQTMSLLVTAAQSHSPEPSMTQKGLSEKTLLLFCSRMGRRGDRQREQRRALSPRVCVHVCVCARVQAATLFHCCFLRQVLPPPRARGARPNDGKVIHHWSTTAANWISPPPINMQSCLAKVSRKGWVEVEEVEGVKV